MSKVKISAAKAAAVYAEVPGVLRALSSELENTRTKLARANIKLAGYQERERIEKIAHQMGTKGIQSSHEDRVDLIKRAHANGKNLDVIEEAVELTVRDGSFAKLAESPGNGGGHSQLEAYLLDGISE